ncbi:RNA polymerase sigma factor [Kiloniella laminariae]|uniref:RNA polymerase sigma factor n=1 Tax=Kiloniella laminariae TaxID=454162 RepID=UPI0012F72598|nr:sigma-70 family RNA polymerase sigma factor [Kiloniella laminariae]
MVIIGSQPKRADLHSQHVWRPGDHPSVHKIEASVTAADQFKTEMIGLLPRLHRFALTLTRSGPDADDLLQDACTTALQKWHQFDPAQPLDRWMFRILRNLWISETRKRKVRQGQGQVPAEEATRLQAENADDALKEKQLQNKVSALPDELSQPLMLVCAEGYSYREVSALLEIPIGTVMSRIHRARKLLASELGEEERIAT